MANFKIYAFGTKAKCPVCSSVMSQIGEATRYRCADCGSTFEITGLDRREDYFLGKKLEVSK
ncbi:MAG: hypothetical protein J1E83_12735 [Lachnospiraceae bacterium]|nr:hypothetical protein [Lachnospiraceae bacterium]